MAKLKDPISTKSSVLEKAPTEVTKNLLYSDEENLYISNLQRKLENARTIRSQPFEEFDNMTYLDYWWTNERGANTVVQFRKNKGDINFQTGTLRTKMFAFLSSFQALNLQADITAYNRNDILLNT